MKRCFVILTALSFSVTAWAQQTQGPRLPVNVPNVTLTGLNKNPADFPDYGEKHMMIFYVDPDAHRQNREFQTELEAKQQELYSPGIQAYAIVNLKDTIYTNAIVRAIAERRTKDNPSVNLADAGRILPGAWGLGDCNGKFCLLFLNRDCELVYFRAGEFTTQNKADFYDTVARYR